MTEIVLRASGVEKTFTLHLQGAAHLPVLRGASFEVRAGEGIALAGASGAGKSTFLRCLYGNYGIDGGSVSVRDGDRMVDISALRPHELALVRRRSIGYVSQFLRVIPRVPALDVAAEPLCDQGSSEREAREAAAALFTRLLLPERLWSLSPTTFSGGEKQRVNIARNLVVPTPLLLVDEPTSALDPASRERVLDLLLERKSAGTALVGIYHDDAVRERLADRVVTLVEGVAA